MAYEYDADKVVKRMEKNVCGWNDPAAAAASIAISLKRIADTLAGVDSVLLEIRDAIQNWRR